MQLRRVVVTGIGALTPIGNTAEEFWHGLVNGVSGAAPITLFDADKFKTKFACEVKGFDPLNYLERKEARKMDRSTMMAMAAAQEAYKDSGLESAKLDPLRCGAIWGSGIGGIGSFQKEIEEFAKGDGTPRFTPFFIPKLIPDITPGHFSIKYNLKGPNFSTVSACASATNAITEASNYIRLGKADLIFTGGAEAAVTEAGLGGFNSMRALSERNDSPETASRPFDKDRDGFVIGEGAGVLILEEYKHAKARGAKIYAELKGNGATADAYHITAPHPEGLGAINVMNMTLKDAGMQPEDIDYINVHGTATPLGDLSEAVAILKVFGNQAYKLNISSTKSMTGHLLGAAGAVEAIAAILAIKNQMIPPTINHFTDDERIDNKLNFTFNKAQARMVRAVLSNTFGFGGHNFSVILSKLDE